MPCSAQNTRYDVKLVDSAMPHVATAVNTADHSSTRWWPTRSPSFDSGGTHSAESSSCAASNQFTSASWMSRWRAMSVASGV